MKSDIDRAIAVAKSRYPGCVFSGYCVITIIDMVAGGIRWHTKLKYF